MMSKFFVALLIGAVAGIIDVIPMLLQKLNKYANLSAFVFWLVLGVVIAYVQSPLAPWLKGLLIAEASAAPIAIMVAEQDKKSMAPILLMSAILGALVGLAAAKFAV